MRFLKNAVKICFAVFLINLYVLQVVFDFSIPNCTQITNIIAVAMVLLEMLASKELTNKLIQTIMPMIVYFGYILISGIAIALFQSYDLSLVIPYAEKMLLALIISSIILNDFSGEYIYLLGIIIAAILGVFSLTNNVSLAIRLRLSETVSENTAGLIFLFGIICTYLTKSRIMNSYVKLALNALFMTGIILTASRQAIILAFVVYLGWFIRANATRTMEKNGKVKARNIIFALFCFLAAIYLIYSGIFDLFQETKLYVRLTGGSQSTIISDNTRRYLYTLGIQTFLKNPIVGCGFNNLPQYTHSTYLEVLGGTGLIGFLVFYYPFIRKAFSWIRIAKRRDANSLVVSIEKITLLTVVFAMMLFRAVHYYNISIIIISLIFTDYKGQISERSILLKTE